MVRNDSQGKKMTSLRSPLWRRLLDVLFVSSSPFSPASSLLPLAAGARLTDFECVCLCMCDTEHILGPFGQDVVGNWSPMRVLNPGGKGDSDGFGERLKFLEAF